MHFDKINKKIIHFSKIRTINLNNQEEIDDIIEGLKNKLSITSNLEEKFSLVNAIIEIERTCDKFNNDLYIDIKIWFKLYIRVIEGKAYNYDKLSFQKIKNKILYLNLEEQIEIINFIIRLLNKNLLNENIQDFMLLQKKLKLKYSFCKKGYFFNFIKNIVTYNFLSLFLTLIFSIFIFSIINKILENQFNNFSIELSHIHDNEIINFMLNIISIIFSLNGDKLFDNINELIFLLIIKLYIFILITYFIIKDISYRLEK